MVTLQPSFFGKTYVVNCYIFIVMTLFWTWEIDHFKPDKYDIIGGIVLLVSLAIILFVPRQ